MRLLVVEDEPALAAQLREALHGAGYAVDCAADGVDGHYLGEVERYDAVVLDLGLPRMDGLTVLRKWRAADMRVPVLILTARDGWHEKVTGIDAGADDYLTKPFNMQELLARLRALIRRSAGHASSIIELGPLVLDTARGEVTVRGVGVALTSHEFRLLSYLMHRPEQVISRSELTEHLYAQDYERDSNTIEVFVTRLRKKLPAGSIETVRGLGYRLVGSAEPSAQ